MDQSSKSLKLLSRKEDLEEFCRNYLAALQIACAGGPKDIDRKLRERWIATANTFEVTLDL